MDISLWVKIVECSKCHRLMYVYGKDIIMIEEFPSLNGVQERSIAHVKCSTCNAIIEMYI